VIILFILVWGMAAGWLASLITGRGRGDWGLLLAVGFGGSFIGGLLASLIAGDGLDLRPSGIIGSVVGAVVLLLIFGGRGRSRR